MRFWGTSWPGSALSALAYAFGAPVMFQYCNVIYLIGAAWLPLGVHAIDRWVRLGRGWGVLELAIVLAMQLLGGDPQSAYLLGICGIGYALGLAWSQSRLNAKKPGGTRPGRSRRWLWLVLAAIMPVALVGAHGATRRMAADVPRPRQTARPAPLDALGAPGHRDRVGPGGGRFIRPLARPRVAVSARNHGAGPGRGRGPRVRGLGRSALAGHRVHAADSRALAEACTTCISSVSSRFDWSSLPGQTCLAIRSAAMTTGAT